MRFTILQTVGSSAIATIMLISLVACSASNSSTTATHSSSELAQPINPQPIHTSSNLCDTAIRSTKSQLEQLQQGKIWINQVDVAQLNPSFPNDRPHAYAITLDGQAASNVMKSPQLMQSISTNLISNCSTVSLVSFGKAQTDWSIHFGLIGSTQIEQFQCVNEPTPDRLPWGYKRCL